MQKIIDFILRYKEYLVFISLCIISLSLISLGNVNQLGGYRSFVIAFVGRMQNVFSWIPNPIAMKNENRALRELNLQLSTEVTRLQHAVFENEKLREMLQFKI